MEFCTNFPRKLLDPRRPCILHDVLDEYLLTLTGVLSSSNFSFSAFQLFSFLHRLISHARGTKSEPVKLAKTRSDDGKFDGQASNILLRARKVTN